VDQYTNHDFVEKAFEECDLNHEGRLSYEEFKMWVQRTPGTLEYLESILPFSGHKDHHTHHTRLETLPLVSMLKNAHTHGHTLKSNAVSSESVSNGLLQYLQHIIFSTEQSVVFCPCRRRTRL
jgi:hypothetical protein